MTVRHLGVADRAAVAELFAATPDYAARLSGRGPTEADVRELFESRPPGVDADAKVVLGWFEGGELVGVADLVRGFPRTGVAYVGLLLVRGDRQGRGTGRALHEDLVRLARRWGATTMRLGVVAANAAGAEPFWHACGYRPTGEVRPYETEGVRSVVTLWERPVGSPAASSGSDVDRIVADLGLEPLPHEGGRFARHHLDEHTSAIYYLLERGECSAMHRLAATEVYHHYAGAPLRLLLLDAYGGVREPVLGPDVAAGQPPCVVVPAGTWQGSSPLGDWTLIGTTMSPPFDWSGFELGDRAALVARYPAAESRIRDLTPTTS